MSVDDKKRHQPEQYQILEFARSAAVQAAANLLEHVADAQRARRKMEATFGDDRQGSPNDDTDTDSDMLFDMLKLNAHYLNEAARLGHRYKDIAQRALENMYARMAPRARTPSAQQLDFDEEYLRRKFAIENDTNLEADEATLEWPGILNPRKSSVPDPKESNWRSPFELRVQKTGIPVELGTTCSAKVPLVFGTATLVEVTLVDQLFVGRRSSFALTVRIPIAGRRMMNRTIPVVIDGTRIKKKPRARTGKTVNSGRQR